MNEAHLDLLRTAHARIYGVTWFTVERPTRESDGAGGVSLQWNTVASGNGTFKRTRADRRDIQERVSGAVGVSLICAYDADVRQGDRVKAKGITYDVMTVDIDSDELLVRTVTLEVR